MSNRTCPTCSAEVSGPKDKIYCSGKCRKRNKYTPKPKVEKPCAQCGCAFSGTLSAAYCSPKCKNAKVHARRVERGYYARPDVKARQASYQQKKYRADVGAGKASGSRLAAWAAAGADGMADLPDVAHCAIAGCEKDIFALVRCRSHYHSYMRDQGKPWAEEYFAPGNDGRIRAKKYGVPFERFSKVDVFDRDGYVCGICDDPVDKSLKYPDPMSVSLDHVVPLSRGGGHLFENSQCSHLICNIRKGARVGESRVLAGSS